MREFYQIIVNVALQMKLIRYICDQTVTIVTKPIPMKTLLITVLSLLFFGAASAVGNSNETDHKKSPDHDKVGPITAKAERPVLPKNLLKPGESAEIVICAAIDEDGDLVNTRTVSTTHKELEKIVMESLEKWEFRPAMLNGKPVKSRVDIPFKFVVAKN